MNKTELTKAIADESGLSHKDSEKFLNSFMDVATKTLKKGEDIALIGFESFSVTERSARIGRNFQTGKPIKVPASKSVKFKAGKNLKNAIVVNVRSLPPGFQQQYPSESISEGLRNLLGLRVPLNFSSF